MSEKTDKKMTKEQAQAAYDDLHRTMEEMLARRGTRLQPAGAKQPEGAVSPQAAATQAAAAHAASKTAYSAKSTTTVSASSKNAAAQKSAPKSVRTSRVRLDGQGMALIVIAFLGCAKISVSALAATGVGQIQEAQAVVTKVVTGPKWSKEEAKILTSLDARRVELEERTTRLEKRESEFSQQERELAIRLTELRDLSERLKTEREKGDKQRHTQLDQLANVYGSMNPPEAAHLLEQLDIQVSLALIERMPEKRMAQILALMTPARALELTNMLSRRKG